MNYFSYSDESILKKPVFKKFEEKKKVLDLISNKGVIYENGEKIKIITSLLILIYFQTRK